MGDRTGESSGTGAGSMRYYTSVGPVQGPAFDRRVPPTIEVLKAPDDAEPIGTALCVASGDKGIAIWRLIVHGAALPEHWIVVDRQFWPADLGAARPCRPGVSKRRPTAGSCGPTAADRR